MILIVYMLIVLLCRFVSEVMPSEVVISPPPLPSRVGDGSVAVAAY